MQCKGHTQVKDKDGNYQQCMIQTDREDGFCFLHKDQGAQSEVQETKSSQVSMWQIIKNMVYVKYLGSAILVLVLLLISVHGKSWFYGRIWLPDLEGGSVMVLEKGKDVRLTVTLRNNSEHNILMSEGAIENMRLRSSNLFDEQDFVLEVSQSTLTQASVIEVQGFLEFNVNVHSDKKLTDFILESAGESLYLLFTIKSNGKKQGEIEVLLPVE